MVVISNLVDIASIDKSFRNESHELLKSIIDKFKTNDFHCHGISIEGEPRRQLQDMIKQIKPDFVIMGKKGVGAFNSVWLGSVSDHMIHHLDCPVMIFPS